MSNVTVIVEGDGSHHRPGHGSGHGDHGHCHHCGDRDHVFTVPNIYHVLQLIREDVCKLSEADCRILRELGEIKILLNYIVRLIGQVGPPPDPGSGLTISLSQVQSGSPSIMAKTKATAQFPPLPDDSSDIDHLKVVPTYQDVAGDPLTFPKDATTGEVGVFDGPGTLSAVLSYVDPDGLESVHPQTATIEIPDEVPPNMPPPDPGTFGFSLEQVPDEG